MLMEKKPVAGRNQNSIIPKHSESVEKISTHTRFNDNRVEKWAARLIISFHLISAGLNVS